MIYDIFCILKSKLVAIDGTINTERKNGAILT